MRLFRKRKPVAPPWNGEHELRYALFEQFFGNMPDDYHSGWVWKCSCGTGTPSLPFGYSFTEAEAVAAFRAHAALYEVAP